MFTSMSTRKMKIVNVTATAMWNPAAAVNAYLIFDINVLDGFLLTYSRVLYTISVY